MPLSSLISTDNPTYSTPSFKDMKNGLCESPDASQEANYELVEQEVSQVNCFLLYKNYL